VCEGGAQEGEGGRHRGAESAVGGTDFEGEAPLGTQDALGAPKGHGGVVDVGGFGPDAVELDDLEVFPAPECLCAGVSHVESSEKEP
jgi:hypothetical protein